MLGEMFSDSTSSVAHGTGAAFTLGQWGRLAAGSLLCLAACDGLMRVAGVPAQPGFEGSLLAGSGPVTAVLVAAVVFAAGLVIGTLVAGSVGIEGALCCACLGLTAMAVRRGPIRPVLEYAPGRGVLIALAIECLLLAAVVYGGWSLLGRVARAARRSATGEAAVARAVPDEVRQPTPAQKASVLGVTVLVTAVVELILVQTPAAAQSLAGVAIASFVGVLAGYNFLPLGDGGCYWTAPTVVGGLGFLIAWLTGDSGAGGEPQGWGAALARATPLDDASLGTAMAVLAHWACRRWAQAAEPPALADPETVIA